MLKVSLKGPCTEHDVAKRQFGSPAFFAAKAGEMAEQVKQTAVEAGNQAKEFVDTHDPVRGHVGKQ